MLDNEVDVNAKADGGAESMRKGSEMLLLQSQQQEVPKHQLKQKIVKETRVTCNSCGNVWHFGKAEQIQEAGKVIGNMGKDMSCCTGSCLGCIPRSGTVDLEKCQKCGSKNVIKEVVEHEV